MGYHFETEEMIIVVGSGKGDVRGWSGPQSNPSLDFETLRKNMLFDFTLSTDGSCAAFSTRDSMIRTWSIDTGSLIAAYSPPGDSCRRIALSMDGTSTASASINGTIRI